MTEEQTIHYWADWLVDAVANATQDRRFLRGEPDEDKIATEAILLNGTKAIRNVLDAFKADRDAK